MGGTVAHVDRRAAGVWEMVPWELMAGTATKVGL